MMTTHDLDGKVRFSISQRLIAFGIAVLLCGFAISSRTVNASCFECWLKDEALQIQINEVSALISDLARRLAAAEAAFAP